MDAMVNSGELGQAINSCRELILDSLEYRLAVWVFSSARPMPTPFGEMSAIVILLSFHFAAHFS